MILAQGSNGSAVLVALIWISSFLVQVTYRIEDIFVVAHAKGGWFFGVKIARVKLHDYEHFLWFSLEYIYNLCDAAYIV